MNKNEQEKSIRYLLDLMDDENEQTASLAMAELLRSDRQDLVNRHLCELQETARPGLRRRVHQLESAIGARFYRSYLAEKLRENKLHLLDGVIRLHLCWYDNDHYENVISQWSELRSVFFDAAPSTMIAFSSFMIDRGFVSAPDKGTLRPDGYCIGAVLDDLFGSDLLLSVIASQLSVGSPFSFRVVRQGLDFGVMEQHGYKMFPSENWRVVRRKKGENIQYVHDGEILRMIASILYFCAVSSDGFRYLYTLGSALSSAIGQESMDFLPYPYGTAKKQ